MIGILGQMHGTVDSGMGLLTKRHDLKFNVVGLGALQQVVDLAPHDVRPTGAPFEDGLFDDAAVGHERFACQQCLACHPVGNPLFDLHLVERGRNTEHHGTGIRLGLERPRHQPILV
jgi:hypothetical protein